MKQNGIFSVTFIVGLVLFVALFVVFQQNRQTPALKSKANTACVGTVISFGVNPCSGANTAVDTQVNCAKYACDNGTFGMVGDCNSTSCVDPAQFKAEAESACQASCAAGGGSGPMPTRIIVAPSISPTCSSGVKEIIKGTQCSVGTPPLPNPNGTNSDNVLDSAINPLPVESATGYSHLDVTCWDGSIESYPTVAERALQSCFSDTYLGTLLRTACQNKMSPACSGGPGGTGSVSPTPACIEGVAQPFRPITEACPVPTIPPPSTTANTNPGTVIDSKPTVEIELKGVMCADGSIDTTYSSGCATKEVILPMMQSAMKDTNLCYGKKSIGCSTVPSYAPSPTKMIYPTSGPSCKTTSIGDCNCSGSVDIADFECWRKQYNNEVACGSADFNGNGACQLSDFEILRKNIF